MRLGELIEILEREDPDRIIHQAFHKPHSCRADYYDLAFEPAIDLTIREMLGCAYDALGKTFTGYKGGDFKMGSHTIVHVAEYGTCGEPLTIPGLQYVLSDADQRIAALEGQVKARDATIDTMVEKHKQLEVKCYDYKDWRLKACKYADKVEAKLKTARLDALQEARVDVLDVDLSPAKGLSGIQQARWTSGACLDAINRLIAQSTEQAEPQEEGGG